MRITPKGYLKDFLKKQMDGLTGHIEVAGFPFNAVEWGQPDVFANDGKPNWWVYEQTAYWLDGYTRAAILLGDKNAIDRAGSIIYNVLNNDENGYLGPKQLKAAIGEDDRWPHVVFFRACMALYDYNGDKNIVDKLVRHYIESPVDFGRGRNVLNVEIMCWLYKLTSNKKLLELAEKSYADYNEREKGDICDKVAVSDKKPRAHGVGYNEYSKLGAILYSVTGRAEYLRASVCAYKKIDKYFMLPDGLHSSSEFLESDNVMESHETCCVTDYTWSLDYLFDATHDAKYLDKIEKCIFNAGLGVITDDFKALQYLSCVNQLVLDNRSNHNLYWKGEKWMSYRPRPAVACCTGNVNRFMPNYILHAFKENNNEVVAKLYGPMVFETQGIKIEENTNYPFDDRIDFSIIAQRNFVFKMRIPKWCKEYSLEVDGKTICPTLVDGFVTINVEKNCSISLTLTSKVERNYKRNAVWFTKGALVYALKVPYKAVRDENDENSSDEFPAYEIYPDGKWNYGIEDDAAVAVNDDGTLSVDAYEIKNWRLLHRKSVKRTLNQGTNESEIVKGDFVFTPPIPVKCERGDKTKIKLVPFGSAKCRITAFPRVKLKR